jgi:streptogramin lyase
MRKKTLALCASALLFLSLAATPSIADEVVVGQLNPDVVPDADIVELGPAMSAVNVRAGAYGYLADGTPVAYIPSNGEPATFTVIDLRTGESLFAAELEGYTMLGSAHVSTDGTVYFNGQNPTPGALFRYFPEEERLEHIGDNIGGQTWLRDVSSDADGTLFMSTYPDAKLLAYDPDTGSIRDYGNVSPDASYGYAVEVVGDEVWVGTGTVPHIIAVDKVSGEMREIDLPEEFLPNTNYVLNLQRRGNHVFAGLSPRGSFETLVYDLRTGEWVASIDSVSASGISPLDGTKVYHFAGRELVGFDLETLQPFETAFAGTPAREAMEGASLYALGLVQLDRADFPGDTLVGVTNLGEMWFFDPATGASEVSVPDVHPSAPAIIGFGIGPDGDVYSGAKVGPNLIGRIDAETHEISQLPGPSQAEGIGAFGDMMVIGKYSGAELYAGTLDEEWDWGTNPKQLFALGRGAPHYQDRIWTMVDVGEYMALGTIPEPGQNGGALVLADPRTGEHEVFRHLIQDQSIVSVTERGGVVYGATSIHGGSSTPPAAEAAVVFAWDVATRSLLWQFAPLPGAGTLGALTWGPDGHLWAVAEQGVVLELDVDARSVVGSTRVMAEIDIPEQHPWSMYSSLAFDEGTGGFFGTVGWQMFYLDPDTHDFGFLRDDTYRLIKAGNGDLFCASKAQVCSVTPVPGDGTAPATTLVYAGTNWIEVTLTARDDDSGVARTEFRRSDGEWEQYTAPLSLKRSDREQLAYRSIDNAGNVEPTRCVTFAPGGGRVRATVEPDEVCVG